MIELIRICLLTCSPVEKAKFLSGELTYTFKLKTTWEHAPDGVPCGHTLYGTDNHTMCCWDFEIPNADSRTYSTDLCTAKAATQLLSKLHIPRNGIFGRGERDISSVLLAD